MKVTLLVGAIFSLVGLVLLGVAGVIYARDAAFASGAQRATGEVIALIPSWDSDNQGSPAFSSRVRFRTDEGRVVEFVESLSSRPPRHAEGERVSILYDGEAPSNAVVDDFSGRLMAVAIVGGLGALFTPVGFIMVAASFRASRRRTLLERTGRSIEAELLHVFRDHRLSINGGHPFRVAVQAIDPSSGSLRRFDSRAIWVDPTSILQGRPVNVLLGEGGAYLVDLRDIVDAGAYAE